MKVIEGKGALGFRVIGAMKVASGLLIGAAGVGLFRLMNRDLGEVLEHTFARLHLDPENRLVREVVSRVAGIDRSHLRLIQAGTFFYCLLHLVEGTGLLLRQRWAGYLTVIATASLLPLELYEIYVKRTPLRLGVLAVNVVVLVYLIVRLRQEREADKAEAGRVPSGGA
jgi:uncharacterized membrane protein (DUF2068 family)